MWSRALGRWGRTAVGPLAMAFVACSADTIRISPIPSTLATAIVALRDGPRFEVIAHSLVSGDRLILGSLSSAAEFEAAVFEESLAELNLTEGRIEPSSLSPFDGGIAVLPESDDESLSIRVYVLRDRNR